ncbi:hypothetical protein MSAN_01363700 [Mycena sanguinolenta]|uniref:Uncharacterized protein n=1 Tax=Mycena sanguinolenta TaxID=230812 RepID=A0A8H7D3I7_9AGAR|nr:hypothetical protein MSAN_01363700 [Mycena sanguinolenta]
MSILAKPQYAGVLGVLRPVVADDWDSPIEDGPAQDEIDDDIEGEQQTMEFDDHEVPDLVYDSDDEDSEDEDSDADCDSDGDAKMKDLKAVIKEASKGVVESTDAEYKRLNKQCEKFIHDAGFISEDEDFFTNKPHPQSAIFIVAWIMSRCDDIELDGKPKDPSIPRDSYSHAQKMRASATYGFGRLNGLGSLPWQKSEVSGRMLGNPSISEDVSRYMVSLRKKKVRAGEVATSARAITPEIIGRLYHHNNKPEVAEIKPITRRKRTAPADINEWGGGALASCSTPYISTIYVDAVKPRSS